MNEGLKSPKPPTLGITVQHPDTETDHAIHVSVTNWSYYTTSSSMRSDAS